MARRRTNTLNSKDELPNETLSSESPKVQEEVLKDILNPDNTQENQDKQGKTKKEKENNLSANKKIEIKFEPGDIVKLHKDVKFDILGRRIHEGLRNYNYRILSIRIDGMLIIECLTHCFTVEPTMVDKI